MTQEATRIYEAMQSVQTVSIKPVAFIKRGFDEYDGKSVYSLQYYLFGELCEDNGRHKEEDLRNVCGLTKDQFELLIG
jgi:hypothetical protein